MKQNCEIDENHRRKRFRCHLHFVLAHRACVSCSRLSTDVVGASTMFSNTKSTLEDGDQSISLGERELRIKVSQFQ